MEQSIDIKRFILAFKRHFWLFVLTVVLTLPLGPVVAYLIPTSYTSKATILIESQRIPDSLAQSTIVSRPEERLSLIEQRILSRSNILEVTDRLGLFADDRSLTPTEKVTLVKEATRFRNIRLNVNRRLSTVSAFEIAVTFENPVQAARLANEFVTMTIEQNVQSRSLTATDTHNFFREEADRLSTAISRLEAEITEYKLENTLALPEGMAGVRQELLFIQERFLERENRRLRLNREKDRIESLAAVGSPNLPGQQLTPVQQELQTLYAQLAAARGLFTDEHPQIRMLKSRIEALEADSVSAGTSTNNGEEVTGASTADNGEEGADAISAGIQTEIEASLAAIGAELRSLDEQDAAAEERMKRLQKAVGDSPAVAMTLNAFERRFLDLQGQYQSAVKKRAEAEIGERMEVNRQAERFEIVEQAQVPSQPDSSRRLIVAGGGVAGSLGLGFALVIMLELLNGSIRTPNDLRQKLDLHAVVVIPYIQTPAELRRQRWTFRIAFASILIFTPVALFAFDQQVMPLPLLADRVLEKVGLEDVARRFL